MIFTIMFFIGIGFLVTFCIIDNRVSLVLEWMLIVGLLMAFWGGILWLFGGVSYAENYNNFVQTSAYYEELKDESLLNAGAINSKMEQNEWLIDTQYWYKNYPFVSFADEKVMELELIK